MWHLYKHTINSIFNLKTKKIQKMGKVTFRPIGDRVLVKPAEAEETTKGGIIIPDTAKEKPQRGKVIAIGTGKKDEPITVKVGDTITHVANPGEAIQGFEDVKPMVFAGIFPVETDDFEELREAMFKLQLNDDVINSCSIETASFTILIIISFLQFKS